MEDSISIRNKITEFSALYRNRQIDDFDTFVRARVADYYINQGCSSTDTIYTEIEEALYETSTEDTKNVDADGNGAAGEVVLNDKCFNTHSSPTNIKMDSVLPEITKAVLYTVGACVVFASAIAWVVKHKGGNTF